MALLFSTAGSLVTYLYATGDYRPVVGTPTPTPTPTPSPTPSPTPTPTPSNWTAKTPPVLTAVSGTYSAGVSRTVSGSNISALRSAKIMHHDFEGGTVGQSVGTVIPEWDNDSGAFDYVISDADSFTGSKSALLDFTVGSASSFFPGTLITASTEIFYKLRMKIVEIIPRQEGDDAAQLKLTRAVIGPVIDNDSDEHNAAPNLGIIWHLPAGGTEIHQSGGEWGEAFYSSDPPLNAWFDVNMYCKLSGQNQYDGARMFKGWGDDTATLYANSSTNPGGHFGSPSGAVVPESWEIDDTTNTLGTVNNSTIFPTFGKILWPFYKRETMHYKIYIDLFAYNDSLEDVLLGDAATFTACTKLIPQKYSARDEGGAEFICEAGDISGSVWLYVMNRDGYTNATGYAMGTT